MNNTHRRYTFLAAGVLAAGAALSAGGARAQSSASGDRISVNLTDPGRPALVKASLVNGGFTVKAYEGKEIIVEARVRGHEREESASGGLRRLNIGRTGLAVEEENNEVRIGTESYNRPIDLVISVPARTSLRLRAVNDGDIVVNGVEGELDVDDVNGF